jgi:trafficking protein particle complex subunit 2
VGKQNNPLFIQTFNQEDELKFHFVVHTSLDIVEEKLAKLRFLLSFSFFFFTLFGRSTSLDAFLGVLYPTEDWTVYGHVTSSGTKLIVVVDDT